MEFPLSKIEKENESGKEGREGGRERNRESEKDGGLHSQFSV